MAIPQTQYFEHEGHRLAYVERGEGDRVVVLLHGLLLSKKMHRNLARTLAEREYRVVSLDLLGHGQSDRPADMTLHSMQLYAQQAIGLLDHLGVERAAFLGTSLGANTTLEVAALAPERMEAMVLEMPVLDSAIVAAAIAFLPFMIAMQIAGPVFEVGSWLARRVPTTGLGVVDTIWDWPMDPPKPSLAVMRGLFFGRIAPPKAIRRTLTPPALVIGHPNDPVHPFTDSDELVRELPNGRLLEAESIIEMRVRPERISREIEAFLDEAWAAGAKARRKGAARKPAARKRVAAA